jgi:hypothetical protein
MVDSDAPTPGYVPLGGRDAELQAIALLRNPRQLRRHLLERRWADVVPLAEYMEHGVPHALAHTDPALYRTLRAAETELHVAGFGSLNAQALRRLAGGN